MDRKHTLNRGLLSLAAISATLVVVVPTWVVAQEPMEEIVVTATYRGSLRQSLEFKKNAVGVVDSINAEDLGKFPDRNLGEAMQRIPGVTLTRDFASNGEGRKINVRGLPSSFIRTTLNGVTAASSATDGGNIVRSFDFDIFATELFSGVTVAKSASADIAEGGLTAVVDMRTPRPFDYDETRFVVSATGHYATLSDQDGGVDPRIAVLYSDTFGDWGFAGSIAYSDISNRGDWSNQFRYERTGNAFLYNTLNGADRIEGTADDVTQADIDAWGTTTNGAAATLAQLRDVANNTLAPQLPRVGPLTTQRERLGATGTLQFRPSDNLEITADLLYATFDDIQYRSTIDGLTGFNRGGVVPISLTTSGENLAAATLNGIDQRLESVEDAFESDFTHFTLSADWDIGGGWTGFGRIGYSDASSEELRRTYLFQLAPTDPSRRQFNFDISNPNYPQFSGTTFDYLDEDQYVAGGFRFRPRNRDTDELSIEFSTEKAVDMGVLSTVKIGVRYADASTQQRRAERRTFDTSVLDLNDFSQNVRSFAPDFLGEAPSGTPTNFLIVNPAAGAAFIPRSLIPNVYNSADFDALGSFGVDESTLAAFISTEWDMSWGAAQLGVRLVQTDQDSIGVQSANGAIVPITINNKYTDTLPSFNIRFDLSDELKLRFAASKTLARATLGNLSPGITLQPTTLTGSAGNPNLDPFSSSNFDLGLEWYFGAEGLLAVAAFHKEIGSFITSGTFNEVVTGTNLVNDDGENVSGSTFAITRPSNRQGGTLSGVELTWQQPFGDTGFGILANVTLSDSEQTDANGFIRQIQGHSDTVYNAVGYYEKHNFSIRASYSFRSDYLSILRNNGIGGAQYEERIDDRVVLDLATSYDINDNFKITFDIQNVTGEDFQSFAADRSRGVLLIDQEPVYIFGVRYNY